MSTQNAWIYRSMIRYDKIMTFQLGTHTLPSSNTSRMLGLILACFSTCKPFLRL